MGYSISSRVQLIWDFFPVSGPSIVGLSTYYEALCKELNIHKVKYLLIGGIAVNFYGVERFTRDIDMLIQNSDNNIKNLVKALKKLGYRPFNIPVSFDDFTIPENRDKWVREKRLTAFPVSIPNTFVILDILFKELIDFEKAYTNRVIFGDSIKIPVVGKKDLIELKRLASRPKDIADIQALEDI